MKLSRYAICISAVIFVLLCGATMALAMEYSTTEVTPFSAFMTNTLQPLLSSVVSMVVMGVLTYGAALAKKKWGIEISNATNERIRAVALDAVHAVEEKAALALKEHGEKWLSASKHAEAVNYIIAKVPSISPQYADELVHSAVARVKGLGATAELGR